ncbi:uncharacterized protein BJX67DRAFT_221428 [Aspergillus lucknowensis]|uniref:Uncharacterized protein n=1 Tax=Aspergillus lucknowensis TaxID=176173 RepID=A0ABR4LIZ0_9EURO
MSLDQARRRLNPTVEEVRDETESHNGGTSPEFRVSWPELCTQHESVLSAHARMLQTLGSQVASDPETSRLVSSMLDRTNKLFLQFETAKKHIIPRIIRDPDSSRAPASDSYNSRSNVPPSKGGTGVAQSRRRKRQRLSNDDVEKEAEVREPLLAEAQRLKRKRTGFTVPGDDEDVRDIIPVSLETEDISDEVQRRLEIKEEQRRKRDAGPEKRKRERDNLASNGSSSSLAGTKPRKKFKLSENVNR